MPGRWSDATPLRSARSGDRHTKTRVASAASIPQVVPIRRLVKNIKTTPKPTPTNAKSKQHELKVLTEEELPQVTGGSGGWECDLTRTLC
jgi:hypothetical protein